MGNNLEIIGSVVLCLILSLGPACGLGTAQDKAPPPEPAQQQPASSDLRTIEDVNKQLFDLARLAPGVKLRN